MAQPIKVLIVEDDDFLRTLAYNKLVKNGFTVDTAIDGQSGLTKIKSDTYDVVILDLLLPVIDGFHILEDLKISNMLKKQHIIIFSNLGTESDISQVMNYGVKNYMIKSSFTLDELVSKINEVAASAL